MKLKRKINLDNLEKQKKIKKIISIVFIAIFVASITLPMLSWVILGWINKDVQQEFLKTGEEMVEMPEDFDVETIMSAIDAYFNRRVAYRGTIVETRNAIDGYLENPYRDLIRPEILKWLNKNSDNVTNNPSNTPINPDLDDMFDEEQNPVLPDDEIVEGDVECQHVNLKETVQVASTCSSQGSALYECQDCEFQKVQALPTLEHTYQFVKTVEATKLAWGYTEHVCKVCNYHKYSEFVSRIVDTSFYPPSQQGQAIFGREDWLFYPGGIADYQANNIPSEENLLNKLNIIKTLYDICKERNIQLQLMAMPNKEEVYTDFMPTYQMATTDYKQKKACTIMNYINSNSEVSYIYPLEELISYSRIWQTYYRHDTHWNKAGAFIGIQALYKALGVPTTNPLFLDFEPTVRNGGDLINLGGLSTAQYNNDVDFNNLDSVYRPEATYTYTGSLSSTSYSWSQSTNPLVEKNFCFFGDSFRSAMMPFMMKDFSHCTFSHYSNVNNAELRQNILDADILVLSAVERNQDSIFTTAQAIINILQSA